MSSSAKIEIKNIQVTFISSKTDDYNNDVSYFKVSDSKAKKKLTPILSHQCDECRLPLWKTENGEYMIKVKQKYAPKLLVPETELTVMLTFKYYCMDKDDKLLQGYYCMMKAMNTISDDEN